MNKLIYFFDLSKDFRNPNSTHTVQAFTLFPCAVGTI